METKRTVKEGAIFRPMPQRFLLPRIQGLGRMEVNMPPPIFNTHDFSRVRRRRVVWWWFLLLAGALWLGCAFVVRAADEDALQDLWKQHTATPDDHDALIKACGEFAQAHAGDPLLPVVRGLEEWHRLKAGQKAEWQQMLTADLALPAGALNDGARRLAGRRL